MARISKSYRAFLTHRSARPIWKNAFLLVDEVPLCPDNLSFLAWANLLYSPHCHVSNRYVRVLNRFLRLYTLLQNCLAPNIRIICWVLQVRLCAKCIKVWYAVVDSFDVSISIHKSLQKRVSFDPAIESDRDILQSVTFGAWPGSECIGSI